MHRVGRSHLEGQDLGGKVDIPIPSMSSSGQANAGDSRSVLGVKGRAKPLSFDHKPQNEGM